MNFRVLIYLIYLGSSDELTHMFVLDQSLLLSIVVNEFGGFCITSIKSKGAA